MIPTTPESTPRKKMNLRLSHEEYLEAFLWLQKNKVEVQGQLNRGRHVKDIAAERKVHPTTFQELLTKAGIAVGQPQNANEQLLAVTKVLARVCRELNHDCSELTPFLP
jgi:hypothetical protein